MGTGDEAERKVAVLNVLQKA